MNENKKEYTAPIAEKLEFDYANTVVASEGDKNPAQCAGTNPGQGCEGVLGDRSPGNCTGDHSRKQPFQCVD